jgi:hypothetical protein
LPILGKPILPRGQMLKQWLGSVVRIPNTGIIAVQRFPILEVPLCYKPIKCTGIPKQVINVRLLKFPELWRGMLADRVDEAGSIGSPFVYGRL